jgi:Tfp pilus assembly protein PilV
MRICCNSRQPKEAFGIVEILVAFVMLAIMFTSLYAGLSSGFSVISLARENLRATQIALEKMETVRMYSWDQINSNEFVPATFTAPFYPSLVDSTNTGITYYGTTVITNISDFPSAYSNSMRQIIVTVRWTNRNNPHSRTMQTFVSQYGMQRYIF